MTSSKSWFHWPNQSQETFKYHDKLVSLPGSRVEARPGSRAASAAAGTATAVAASVTQSRSRLINSDTQAAPVAVSLRLARWQ